MELRSLHPWLATTLALLLCSCDSTSSGGSQPATESTPAAATSTEDPSAAEPIATPTATAETAQAPVRLALPAPLPKVKRKPLFSVPVGNEGLRYIQEGEEWGPSACAVAPDGSFWIADTATLDDVNRFVHVSRRGKVLGRVLADAAPLTGLSIDQDGNLYTVDERHNRLRRFSPEGKEGASVGVLRSHTQPASLADGTVVVYGSGSFNVVVPGDELQVELRAGLSLDGVEFVLREHEVRLGGRTTVETGEDDAFCEFQGQTPEGGPILMAVNAKLQESLVKLSPQGEPVAVAYAPFDWYVPVQDRFCVGPDGKGYAMVTRPKRVDIIELEFVPYEG